MNTLYRDNQKFTKDEAVMELLKDRGFTTEPPNKYNPNGSLRVTPEKGEKYWYVDFDSLVELTTTLDDNSDHFRHFSQNMFDTEEAAEKARTMQLVAQPLIAKIWEIDADWECDWYKAATRKYYIYYNYKDEEFTWLFHTTYQHQGAMIMSQKAADHILSATYTDKQRAAFMGDVKLWESFGGKIGDEKE